MDSLLVWWQEGAWLLLLAYFFGSIPSGLLIAKIAKAQDPRTAGSGNFGATNMLRTSNRRLALITLVADMFKGALPTLIGVYLFRLGLGTELLPYLAMLFAVVGHCFPVWLKFCGGKGVATFLGAIAALPVGGFLFVGAISWLLVAWMSRYSSLASLCSTVAVSIYGFYAINSQVGIIFVILSAIIALKHRSNVARLLQGRESRIQL